MQQLIWDWDVSASGNYAVDVGLGTGHASNSNFEIVGGPEETVWSKGTLFICKRNEQEPFHVEIMTSQVKTIVSKILDSYFYSWFINCIHIERVYRK